jgi:monoamine oxidase
MARTPLFRRLVDAGAAVSEAHARGVPTAEVVEERSERLLSRRRFLEIAGIGLGMAACDRAEGITRAAGPPNRARAGGSPGKVAVIGAGLAGLTCAYRLRQAGIDATVYEAADRLGGRCWTRRGDFADGQIAEHGGELIDQSHTTIRQLAQELGLRLDNLLRAEANGTEPFYLFDGQRYPYRAATDDLKAIWQPMHRDLSAAGYPTQYTSFTARGQQLDRMSIAQWIEATVPGGRASRLGQLLDTAYTIEYGADTSDQSALNLLYLLGYAGPGQLRIFGSSNEKYVVRGGNDQIVSRLADALAGRVVRGTPLASIRLTAAGDYELGFERGSQAVKAATVVLALPFSILRARVDFSRAGFSPVKEMAIRELGMGANSKLNVQFRTRLWNRLGCSGETYADTGYQATWEASRGQGGASGILVDYTGADTARAQRGVDAATLARNFMRQAEPVLPGLSAAWNGRATFDDWTAAPWTLGSYSYYRVGQYTRFGGAEAERSGRCHFAGEHTSTDAQGYLEGAVESGERAAREVLGR